MRLSWHDHNAARRFSFYALQWAGVRRESVQHNPFVRGFGRRNPADRRENLEHETAWARARQLNDGSHTAE